MLEIQNQSDRQSGDAEIIQHLPAFMVGDTLNGLGVHDDLATSDQVRNKFANVLAFVEHLESALLVKGDAPRLNSTTSEFS